MQKQVYVNKDVVTAAQERLSYIFEEFENIIVSISGGKDSTVLCYMALQEARRRERKVGVFFLDEEVPYIRNRNSKIFHHSYCSSVSDLKDKNKVEFSTRDAAIEAGYRPCQRCNP